MRLTLVISQMNMGGAEKRLSILANAWASRGDMVTLLALEPNHPSFFELHPAISFRCLGVVSQSSTGSKKLTEWLRRPFSLRRALANSRPDVILSFINRVNTTTILSSIGLGVPVVVMEVTDPFVWKDTVAWRFLRACTYPLANAVVSQTANAALALRKMVGKRSIAIPNPVPAGEPRAGVRSGFRLVSYARFSFEKRLDRLIEAFNLIRLKHPNWSLVIAGDGPMLSELKAQIDRLGIRDQVILPGVLRNPGDLLKSADIFALTSEFEGFPNTLTEAMAYGVPAISFNCRSGPSEIIRDGIDGLLIPPGDVPALASAMDRLMRDNTLRIEMGKKAIEVSDRFSMSRVLSQWDDLFERVGVLARHSPASAINPTHAGGGE
jgi:glycosyltransferase involved in cell wall biosynthesis